MVVGRQVVAAAAGAAGRCELAMAAVVVAENYATVTWSVVGCWAVAAVLVTGWWVVVTAVGAGRWVEGMAVVARR